jgi:hypothetical protein
MTEVNIPQSAGNWAKHVQILHKVSNEKEKCLIPILSDTKDSNCYVCSMKSHMPI